MKKRATRQEVLEAAISVFVTLSEMIGQYERYPAEIRVEIVRVRTQVEKLLLEAGSLPDHPLLTRRRRHRK